jgi:hypothetical protein
LGDLQDHTPYKLFTYKLQIIKPYWILKEMIMTGKILDTLELEKGWLKVKTSKCPWAS